MSVFPQVAQAYNVGLSVTFHDWKVAAPRMGLWISLTPNPLYASLCLVKLVKLTSLWKTNWYNENWILQHSLFIRRAKVSCQRTGSRDSWKMVRALLWTPQKICKWQLLCSCETFQLKSNRFQFITMIHFVHVELDKMASISLYAS